MVEKQIEVLGINTYFTQDGKARDPLFLVLHGWGSSSVSWTKTQELLAAQGFKVVVPDLPGFGKSAVLPQPWRVEDYSKWLKEFVSNFQLPTSNFYLLGHSFGGQIAVKYGSRHPQSIDKLILVSAAVNRTRKPRAISRAAKIGNFFFELPLLRELKPKLRYYFYRYALRRTDYLKSEGVMKETFQQVVTEDLQPLLHYITSPTLIIWGQQDNTTPLEDARIVNKKVAHSRLEILPGLAHSPHKENPELLVEKIIAFAKR